MAGGTNSIGMDNWRVTAAETDPQIDEPCSADARVPRITSSAPESTACREIAVAGSESLIVSLSTVTSAQPAALR